MLNGIAKLRVAGAEARAFAVLGPPRRRGLAPGAPSSPPCRSTWSTRRCPLISLVVIFPLAVRGGDLDAGTFLAFNAAFDPGASWPWSALGTRCRPSPRSSRSTSGPSRSSRPCPRSTRPSADPGELARRHRGQRRHVPLLADGPLRARATSRSAPARASSSPSSARPARASRRSCACCSASRRPRAAAIYFDGQDLAGSTCGPCAGRSASCCRAASWPPGASTRTSSARRPFTVDDAWEAARSAGLDDDIKHMPMGMHTMVSEGGGDLSGGQRQRLLIARAIVGQAAHPAVRRGDERPRQPDAGGRQPRASSASTPRASSSPTA